MEFSQKIVRLSLPWIPVRNRWRDFARIRQSNSNEARQHPLEKQCEMGARARQAVAAGDAAALAGQVVSYAPPVVQDALQPVVDQVLSQRNQALLAIGVLVTVWTASSGVQAIRTALNKAYGIERGLSFWKARIKVTLFTVVGGAATTFRGRGSGSRHSHRRPCRTGPSKEHLDGWIARRGLDDRRSAVGLQGDQESRGCGRLGARG